MIDLARVGDRYRVRRQVHRRGRREQGSAVGQAANPVGGQAQIDYRARNEHVYRLAAASRRTRQIRIDCECVRPECTARMRISRRVYDSVRRFPARFVIKPSHICEENERLVQSTSKFAVVEKVGPDSEKAFRTDPRRHDETHWTSRTRDWLWDGR